jgi:hypothetical protein
MIPDGDSATQYSVNFGDGERGVMSETSCPVDNYNNCKEPTGSMDVSHTYGMVRIYTAELLRNGIVVSMIKVTFEEDQSFPIVPI